MTSPSGYQEGADSGLKLLGHRYYDPSTGRFLTRDPAKDGRNWYGYCENQPLELADPDGDDDGPYTLQFPKLTYGPPKYNYPFPPTSDFPPLRYPAPGEPAQGPGIKVNPGNPIAPLPTPVPVGGLPRPSDPTITVSLPGPTSGITLPVTFPSNHNPIPGGPGSATASLPGGGAASLGAGGGGSITLPIHLPGGGSLGITVLFGPKKFPGASATLKIPF